MFRIARGQYFHEGNKRTALAAGLSFLKANEYTMDITNEDLVKVLDEASVGKASLSKLNSVIRRLIRND
jgi:prophage maintenance system killer protein